MGPGFYIHVGLRDWRLRLTSWKSLLQSPVCWLVPCTRREMMPDAWYIQEVCFQMPFRFWINLFCVRSEPCALGRFLCLCDGRGISSSWFGGQWRETQLVCPMNGFFFSYPVGGCCELCMQNELVLWHSSPAGSRCSGPCCFSPSSWSLPAFLETFHQLEMPPWGTSVFSCSIRWSAPSSGKEMLGNYLWPWPSKWRALQMEE